MKYCQVLCLGFSFVIEVSNFTITLRRTIKLIPHRDTSIGPVDPTPLGSRFTVKIIYILLHPSRIDISQFVVHNVKDVK